MVSELICLDSIARLVSMVETLGVDSFDGSKLSQEGAQWHYLGYKLDTEKPTNANNCIKGYKSKKLVSVIGFLKMV